MVLGPYGDNKVAIKQNFTKNNRGLNLIENTIMQTQCWGNRNEKKRQKLIDLVSAVDTLISINGGRYYGEFVLTPKQKKAHKIWDLYMTVFLLFANQIYNGDEINVKYIAEKHKKPAREIIEYIQKLSNSSPHGIGC